MSRLRETYKNEIVDAMTKKFGYANVMQVPKLDKIVINMGVGEAKDNAKVLDAAVKDLEHAIAVIEKLIADVDADIEVMIELAGKIEVADIENSSNPNPNNNGIAV